MNYTKAIQNGKEVYVVTGVFGDGGSSAYNNEPKNRYLKKKIEEAGGAEMLRIFTTEGEAQAYIQGIADMDGWMGYDFSNPLDHQNVFGTLNGLTILS